MVNEDRICERLVCSEKVKRLIINDCKRKFRKLHPEYDGKDITQNQILTSMIKNYCGYISLDDKHDKWKF